MRIVALADPASMSQIPPGYAISVIQDDGQRISQLFSVENGGVAIVDQRGVVSWVQPAWSVSGSEPLLTLGAVLADLLGGVDVANRMKQQWQEQVNAYQSVLEQQSPN